MLKESSSSVQIFYPKYNRNSIIQILKNRVENLNEKLPLTLVVLFGSYAKGNYSVSSDVDLMVIYKGKLKDKAFAIVKKTLSIPLLEPHVYSDGEYVELKETIDKMIKDGVIIYQNGRIV